MSEIKTILARIGEPAPPLQVSDWLHINNLNLDQLLGQVILIEVFQVNCPACFLYSLPQAIDLHQRYKNKGLSIIGVATAFEDFDINTLDNLKSLITENKVTGETQRVLQAQKRLIDGRLPYHIPFPVAMDEITKFQQELSQDDISLFIKQQIPQFTSYNETDKNQIRKKVIEHLNTRLYTPKTFTQFNLKGTPSHIVIDKKGILKACEFGHFTDLEWLLTSLITE